MVVVLVELTKDGSGAVEVVSAFTALSCGAGE